MERPKEKDLGLQGLKRVKNDLCTGGKEGRAGKVNYPLATLLNGNGVFWLGGNSEKAVPIVKYVVKISHKGLLLWSYSDYQKELSDKVLDLRDREKLTFNAIAEKLILEGYRSPRGFDLGAESVFSIYKKRNIRDARMNHSMRVEIVGVEIEGD